MVLAVALLGVALASPSADGGGDAAASSLRFGDALLAEGDNYRAITEYKRALFLAQDADRTVREGIHLRIGLAYLRGEQHDAALATLRQVESDALAFEASLYAGLAHHLAGRHDRALLLERSLPLAPQGQPRARDRAHYLLGFAALELSDGARAQGFFEQLQDSRLRERLAAGASGLSKLETRSPLAAGLLAILPGAGHAYVGEWGVALAALTWNALFGLALAESIRRGFVAVSVMLGVFELMWYAGNIVGAISAAFKFNRDAVRNHLDQLRRDVPSVPDFVIQLPAAADRAEDPAPDAGSQGPAGAPAT